MRNKINITRLVFIILTVITTVPMVLSTPDVNNTGVDNICVNNICDNNISVDNVTPINSSIAVVPVETTTSPTPIVPDTVPPIIAPIPDPGCWSSYVGFGICVGSRIAETGLGILAGIGKVISNIFGH